MAAETIISRLNSRLTGATSNNRETPDIGTRSMAGSFRTNAPYITGYFHVIFDLPRTIFGSNQDIAVTWLTSTAESFTPPSITINYAELNGLGQIKSRHYSSRQVSNDFTIAFREYQNTPVMNVLGIWAGVFDPHVGVSSLKGNSFIPTSYKGTCYVLQTKPVGAFSGEHLTQEDIEEAWVFDGCWPTALPYDSMSSDLTSADGLQLSVTFSYDGAPLMSCDGAIVAALDAYTSLNHTSINDTFENYLKRPARPISGVAAIG